MHFATIRSTNRRFPKWLRCSFWFPFEAYRGWTKSCSRKTKYLLVFTGESGFLRWCEMDLQQKPPKSLQSSFLVSLSLPTSCVPTSKNRQGHLIFSDAQWPCGKKKEGHPNCFGWLRFKESEPFPPPKKKTAKRVKGFNPSQNQEGGRNRIRWEPQARLQLPLFGRGVHRMHRRPAEDSVLAPGKGLARGWVGGCSSGCPSKPPKLGTQPQTKTHPVGFFDAPPFRGNLLLVG